MAQTKKEMAQTKKELAALQRRHDQIAGIGPSDGGSLAGPPDIMMRKGAALQRAQAVTRKPRTRMK